MPRNFKPSSLNLRNVIIFLHLSGREPADIDRRLKEVYEKHVPTRSTVYKWHAKFASGDYSIEDEDRSGRPMELIWTCCGDRRKPTRIKPLANWQSLLG
ncbi:hypothetical protein RB195_011240 [Necator americanus]|uniref:Mos1 transposase HTH domain-containing protein n=1 Tax=Necator americanus TaxID=51031 RepID=A0ABR1D2I4_NECAM